MINKKINLIRKSDSLIKYVGQGFDTQEQMDKWVEKMTSEEFGKRHEKKLLAPLTEFDMEIIDTTPEVEKEANRKAKVELSKTAIDSFHENKNPTVKQTAAALKEVIYYLRSTNIEKE